MVTTTLTAATMRKSVTVHVHTDPPRRWTTITASHTMTVNNHNDSHYTTDDDNDNDNYDECVTTTMTTTTVMRTYMTIQIHHERRR